MDMSFQRKNPFLEKTDRKKIILSSLLAEVAARQAVSSTARLQAKLDQVMQETSDFCAQAAVFAPIRSDRRHVKDASFNAKSAVLITERQSS